MPVTCAVILSGGMDSATLLYHAASLHGAENVTAITFDYGQRHAVELDYARKCASNLGVTHVVADLGVLGELVTGSALTGDNPVPHGHYEEDSMKSTVVSNRNMVMLSVAAAYCCDKKVDLLWYAIYPDCRPEFYTAMAAAIKLCDWHDLQLEAPFLHDDKFSILKRGALLGVPYADTWTCYEGDGVNGPCGKCGSCQERAEAFETLGTDDPLVARFVNKTGVSE